MIHVNLQTQLHEQLEIIKSFKSDEKWILIWVNASRFKGCKDNWLWQIDSLSMKIKLLKCSVQRILEGLGFAVMIRDQSQGN